MSAAAVSLRAHPRKPSTFIDGVEKMLNQPGSWEKAMQLTLLGLKAFSRAPLAGSLLALSDLCTLGISTINLVQAVNPITYFVAGSYQGRKQSKPENVFFASHMYLSTIDVSHWIATYVPKFHSVLTGVTATSPLFGRVAALNIARFATPVTFVLFAANVWGGIERHRNTTREITKIAMREIGPELDRQIRDSSTAEESPSPQQLQTDAINLIAQRDIVETTYLNKRLVRELVAKRVLGILSGNPLQEQESKVNYDPKEMMASLKTEIPKARLQVIWSIFKLALATLSLFVFTNPIALYGIMAFEAATILTGLVGDGYGVYNP